jgi:DNA polymerase
MGAVATLSVLGPEARVTRDRGRDIQDSPMAKHVVVTELPSALLRGYPEEREDRFAGLVADLRIAASLVETGVRQKNPRK